MEITGSRVALHVFTEEDAEAIAPWYREAERLRGQYDADCNLLAITRREDDGAIGVVAYWLGVPDEGWLAVKDVAVEPRLRGLGFASEAVRLLEEDVVGRGLAARFCAVGG